MGRAINGGLCMRVSNSTVRILQASIVTWAQAGYGVLLVSLMLLLVLVIQFFHHVGKFVLNLN